MKREKKNGKRKEREAPRHRFSYLTASEMQSSDELVAYFFFQGLFYFIPAILPDSPIQPPSIDLHSRSYDSYCTLSLRPCIINGGRGGFLRLLRQLQNTGHRHSGSSTEFHSSSSPPQADGRMLDRASWTDRILRTNGVRRLWGKHHARVSKCFARGLVVGRVSGCVQQLPVLVFSCHPRAGERNPDLRGYPAFEMAALSSRQHLTFARAARIFVVFCLSSHSISHLISHAAQSDFSMAPHTRRLCCIVEQQSHCGVTSLLILCTA